MTPARRTAFGVCATVAALLAPLTATATAAVANSNTSPAVATSANGQIAYVAYGPATIPFGPPTQADVWVMNADGTEAVNVTASADVDDTEPAWSPDGTRLAVVSDSFRRTLTVMNADGSARTAVIDGAYSPSWGPDGTKIAVLRSREGVASAIVIVDVATGAETVVTENALMEPVWSPDGTKIAFVDVREEQYPDPITGEPLQGAQHEIVVVNVDGTGEQVVSAGEPGSERAMFLEEDRAPAWSPDGSMLVFMSQGQVPSCCGSWQLWAVNRDGSGITNLSADDTVNDMFPAWSPDGSLIVFTRTSASGQDLYTMPAPTVLPLPAAPGAARATSGAAPTATAATGPASPLTTDGNAQDPSWGRAVAAPSTVTLTVSQRRLHDGGGRVTSTPVGITCGRECTHDFAVGTTVTLRANPWRGSTFLRWAGACTGRARTCTVTLTEARRVTAVFAKR
jgi:dipeptidyl aminopeptidase/acylaminoacyl peptidase